MKLYKDNNPAFDYQVEAVKVTQDTVAEISQMAGNGIVVEIDPETRERTVGVNIPTREGMTRASEADDHWVIRNKFGEFFVMGDGTFQAHYVEADVEAPAVQFRDLFHERGGKHNGR